MSDEDIPWSEADHNAAHALGFFILAWSTVEGTLEIAIAHQLGLNPLEGSIITAGLQFKARTNTLRALLNRDKEGNKVALAALSALDSKPDRNDIVHGLSGRTETGLQFNRRRVNNGIFKSEFKYYTTIELLKLGVEVASQAANLQNALGISEEQYRLFFAMAHQAQVKQESVSSEAQKTAPSRDGKHDSLR